MGPWTDPILRSHIHIGVRRKAGSEDGQMLAGLPEEEEVSLDPRQAGLLGFASQLCVANRTVDPM